MTEQRRSPWLPVVHLIVSLVTLAAVLTPGKCAPEPEPPTAAP